MVKGWLKRGSVFLKTDIRSRSAKDFNEHISRFAYRRRKQGPRRLIFLQLIIDFKEDFALN